MISLLRMLFLLLAALPAQAQLAGSISIAERRDVRLAEQPGTFTHALNLTVVHFREGGWDPVTILDAAGDGARILAQCGIALTSVDLVLVDAPPRYRYYLTPVSRELARRLPLPRPAVYFVAGTRQRPAFDAEAIGRGNLGPRPELQDTVWIAQGAREPGIAFAHELAHVLMDSGEHSEAPGNLMREETAPQNTQLSAAQCALLRETGERNGLLRRAP